MKINSDGIKFRKVYSSGRGKIGPKVLYKYQNDIKFRKIYNIALGTMIILFAILLSFTLVSSKIFFE